MDFPGGPAVKDSALPLLWVRFTPWPENFHMLWTWPKNLTVLMLLKICFSNLEVDILSG